MCVCVCMYALCWDFFVNKIKSKIKIVWNKWISKHKHKTTQRRIWNKIKKRKKPLGVILQDAEDHSTIIIMYMCEQFQLLLVNVCVCLITSINKGVNKFFNCENFLHLNFQTKEEFIAKWIEIFSGKGKKQIMKWNDWQHHGTRSNNTFHNIHWWWWWFSMYVCAGYYYNTTRLLNVMFGVVVDVKIWW